MSLEDDNNWDNDIVFNQALLEQKLASNKRGNIHARYPDKDLEDAFARLHGPDDYEDEEEEDDDDDETESTFISHHSDKLFVKEEHCDSSLSIPGLDDYMLGSPCSGVVTRLGSSHKQVVLDHGDWEEDIKLPPKGLPSNISIRQPVMESLLHLPEEVSPHQQGISDSLPSLTRKVRFLNTDQINTYTPETMEEQNEQDQENEEGYNDIRFPDDMGHLAIQRASSPPPLTSGIDHLTQPQKVHSRSQSIASSLYKSHIEKEEEDDDFCKDLQIDSDDAFQSKNNHAKANTTTTLLSTNTHVDRSKVSSIPRRIILPESKLTQSRLPGVSHVSLGNRQQHSTRFLAPTYASRQRQAPTTSNNNNSSSLGAVASSSLPRRTFEKSKQQQQQQRMHGNKTNTANGTTLIARPRSSVKYGNGSELDSLDILPDWKRRSLSCWKNLAEKRTAATHVDPQRPWRHNMTRRKPTLIKPEDRTLNKVCNEMKYDSEKHRWQGNEKNLLSFPNNNNNTHIPSSSLSRQRHTTTSGSSSGPRRPALITNMNKKSHASKNAEVIVGSMVFDPIEMKWKKSKNQEEEEEDNVLANIEDLGELNTPNFYRRDEMVHVHTHLQQQQNKMREFKFSLAMKHLIQQQEQEHIKKMENWEFMKKEEDVFIPNNTPVRGFTYLLYHPHH